MGHKMINRTEKGIFSNLIFDIFSEILVIDSFTSNKHSNDYFDRLKVDTASFHKGSLAQRLETTYIKYIS